MYIFLFYKVGWAKTILMNLWRRLYDVLEEASVVPNTWTNNKCYICYCCYCMCFIFALEHRHLCLGAHFILLLLFLMLALKWPSLLRSRRRDQRCLTTEVGALWILPLSTPKQRALHLALSRLGVLFYLLLGERESSGLHFCLTQFCGRKREGKNGRQGKWQKKW